MRGPPRGGSVGQYDHGRYRDLSFAPYHPPGPISRGSDASAVIANDILAVHPIVFPRGGTIDDACFYCSAYASVDIIRHVRIGLWEATSATDLYPAALVAETDVIDFTATGDYYGAIAAVVTPGVLYWGGLVCSLTVVGGEVLIADDELVASSRTYETPVFGFDATMQGSAAYYNGFAFGALPDPFPAGGDFTTLYTWIPGFRFSA